MYSNKLDNLTPRELFLIIALIHNQVATIFIEFAPANPSEL